MTNAYNSLERALKERANVITSLYWYRSGRLMKSWVRQHLNIISPLNYSSVWKMEDLWNVSNC